MFTPASVKESLRIINPFEYQGPLRRPELFFDRKNELEDARIVCEQIVRGRIGGVLVIGGRGAGKTSFLESLQRELDKRKIANAKLPLDESMVAQGNEAKLFKTILTELTEAAQRAGLIETSRATRLKQALMGFLKIEDIGIELPGISFLLRASKQAVSEEFGYIMLRDGLKDFITLINSETSASNPQKGAILLFDEGDTLTRNKVLLQVLRNAFQETNGMGLAVAGTSKLLEQVSEVFSPIPRFFRKIELGPFPQESDVTEAIQGGLNLAATEVKNKRMDLFVVHRAFDQVVITLTGRTPVEVNLLCYFAFDIGAKRIKLENGKVTLYMKVDKELLDTAIKQLRGTKEYNSFMEELDEKETAVLRLLSKCQFGASHTELVALLVLDEVSRSLEALSIDDFSRQPSNLDEAKTEIQNALSSISSKAEKYSIRAISAGLLGKSLYQLEDQWVKAYFKYGSVDPKIDLEFGFLGALSGVRIFGDPIASIVDTLLLPKLIYNLGSPDDWRVNTYPNDGSRLRVSPARKVLNCVYDRAADNVTYHMAFQVQDYTDLVPIHSEAERLLAYLKGIGLITNFGVEEKPYERRFQ